MSKPVRKKLILLLLILTVAFRLVFLGGVPPSLDWDEASSGFNAYSILMQGKDSFGNFLPIAFKSFNDFKAPLQIYLLTLPIKLLGLTEFAVRMPSAIFGILGILGVYFLARNLGLSTDSSQMAALFLALNPWHFQFSRIGVEANIGLTLVIWGVGFFLKGRLRPKFFWLSLSFFSLSLYAYHSFRVFVPVYFILFTCFFLKDIFTKRVLPFFLSAVALSFFLLLPLLAQIKSPLVTSRISSTSAFTNFSPLVNPFEIEQKRLSFDKNDLSGTFFHNRRLAYVKIFLEGYFAHLRFDFLLLDAAKERHGNTPKVGLFYLFDLVFIIIGGYFLVSKYGLLKKVIFAWLALGPIPAAFTFDLPHAIRSYHFLVPLIFLSLLGFEKLQIFLPRILKLVLVFLMFGNVFFFLHQYYWHLNTENSADWQFGFKELMIYLSQNSQNYQKAIFYPRPNTILEKSHVFVLFYSKYDPETYLSEGGSALCRFGTTGKFIFSKYQFAPFDCNEQDDNFPSYLKLENNILIITDPKEFERYANLKTHLSPQKIIYLLNGKPSIHIYNSTELNRISAKYGI